MSLDRWFVLTVITIIIRMPAHHTATTDRTTSWMGRSSAWAPGITGDILRGSGAVAITAGRAGDMATMPAQGLKAALTIAATLVATDAVKCEVETRSMEGEVSMAKVGTAAAVSTADAARDAARDRAARE